MGVSHHSEEYEEMKTGFINYFMTDLKMEYSDAVEVWFELNSIMNDFGAVDWT